MFADENCECCYSHGVAVPSVSQTLDELQFEKGIWNSALHGETEKLQKQLDKGIDPSICDSSGYTALHYAARNGRESTCSLLLQRGANVNAQTPGGATPLLRAASQGHTCVVVLLLQYKADPSICDSDGKTPLHKAAEGQHLGAVRALLDQKPEIKNMKDNRGHLPLFYVNPDRLDIVHVLST